MDYKYLLEQYMKHVVSVEGATLLDRMDYDNTLSEEDMRLLKKVERRLGFSDD